MDLEGLRDEIKRLISLKENRPECTIDMKLKGIQETVDALNIHVTLNHTGSYVMGKLWYEIRQLLNTDNSKQTKESD